MQSLIRKKKHYTIWNIFDWRTNKFKSICQVFMNQHNYCIHRPTFDSIWEHFTPVRVECSPSACPWETEQPDFSLRVGKSTVQCISWHITVLNWLTRVFILETTNFLVINTGTVNGFLISMYHYAGFVVDVTLCRLMSKHQNIVYKTNLKFELSMRRNTRKWR